MWDLMAPMAIPDLKEDQGQSHKSTLTHMYWFPQSLKCQLPLPTCATSWPQWPFHTLLNIMVSHKKVPSRVKKYEHIPEDQTPEVSIFSTVTHQVIIWQKEKCMYFAKKGENLEWIMCLSYAEVGEKSKSSDDATSTSVFGPIQNPESRISDLQQASESNTGPFFFSRRYVDVLIPSKPEDAGQACLRGYKNHTNHRFRASFSPCKIIHPQNGCVWATGHSKSSHTEILRDDNNRNLASHANTWCYSATSWPHNPSAGQENRIGCTCPNRCMCSCMRSLIK